MPPTKSASPETLARAEELAALIGRDRPDLLPLYADLLERLKPYQHAPDFRHIVWFGTSYFFSQQQALVVKALWDAWERGTRKVHHSLLLQLAGSSKKKLSDVFRKDKKRGRPAADAPPQDEDLAHPAWGKLIVSEVRGYWELADPNSPIAQLADPEEEEAET